MSVWQPASAARTSAALPEGARPTTGRPWAWRRATARATVVVLPVPAGPTTSTSDCCRAMASTAVGLGVIDGRVGRGAGGVRPSAAGRRSWSRTAAVVKCRSVTCSLTGRPSRRRRTVSAVSGADRTQRSFGVGGEPVDAGDQIGARCGRRRPGEGWRCAGRGRRAARSRTPPRPGRSASVDDRSASQAGDARAGTAMDGTGQGQRIEPGRRPASASPGRMQRRRVDAVDLGGSASQDGVACRGWAMVRGSGSAPSCSSLQRRISSCSLASTCAERCENTSRTGSGMPADVGLARPPSAPRRRRGGG